MLSILPDRSSLHELALGANAMRLYESKQASLLITCPAFSCPVLSWYQRLARLFAF